MPVRPLKRGAWYGRRHDLLAQWVPAVQFGFSDAVRTRTGLRSSPSHPDRRQYGRIHTGEGENAQVAVCGMELVAWHTACTTDGALEADNEDDEHQFRKT